MSDRVEYPPEWLVRRISDEIRRGLSLLPEDQMLSGLDVDCIHFRLFLKGNWRELNFDGEGRLIAVPHSD